MTTFKNYFVYRMKSSLVSTVSFSLIALLICITTARDSVNYFQYGSEGRTGIEALATIMCIIATLIPMLETNDFKNRRNLDTLYFLPLSRFKLALAHYLSGLFQILVIYTVAFCGHFLVLCRYADKFRLQYMPLYYVLLLLLGVALYSVFIFLFGEANSTADGFICAVLWIFALYLLALVAGSVVKEYAYQFIYKDENGEVDGAYFVFTGALNELAAWFIPYTSVNNLTVVFQNVIEGAVTYVEYPGEIEELVSVHIWPTFAEVIEAKYPQWYMVFLPVVAGAASVFGYFRTFTRKGAEKAGEVSSSPFCYNVLIPIYGFVCLAFTGIVSITFFLIIAAMYLGYAIYRRSFKIKKADVFSMVGTVLAQVALAAVVSTFFRG